MNQALNLYQAANGERLKAGELESQSLKKLIMPYFVNAKDCGMGSGNNAIQACIPNNYYVEEDKRNAGIYKTYNGKAELSMSFFDDGQFIINDGMILLIENSENLSTNIYICRC